MNSHSAHTYHKNDVENSKAFRREILPKSSKGDDYSGCMMSTTHSRGAYMRAYSGGTSMPTRSGESAGGPAYATMMVTYERPSFGERFLWFFDECANHKETKDEQKPHYTLACLLNI